MATPTNDHGAREYVMLHSSERGLRRLPNVIADNAEQATRRAATNLDQAVVAAGVELIAIPARNWTVVQLRLEQKLVTE